MFNSIRRMVFLGVFIGQGVLPLWAADGALEQGFRNPPDSAKPYMWWAWMHKTVTKEGITRDLEAMKKEGVQGAQLFDIGTGSMGSVGFMSPQWREFARHTLSEANRLGLEIAFQNCAGWSSSGGPWMTPELGMQIVVFSETNVHGPALFQGKLSKPPTRIDYYRDIAVLAVQADAEQAPAQPRKIIVGGAPFDGSKWFDGDVNTIAKLPPGPSGTPQDVVLEYAQPFTARSLTILPGTGRVNYGGELQISADGRNFTTVRRFRSTEEGFERAYAVWESAMTIGFEPVTARFWRLRFTRLPSRAKDLAFAEIKLSSEYRLDNINCKAGYARGGDIDVNYKAPARLGLINNKATTIDLSDRLQADGTLRWNVPPGAWTILRFGHTANGQVNHPSGKEGLGLECDKLSREALEAHWKGMMQKIIDDSPALVGKSLTGVLIDSYEVGCQNWTPKLREEFLKRRGYDPTAFLPVLTGRVIESPAVSERFLWDFRRTLADLFNENYYGHFAELCARHKLQSNTECYGPGNFDFLQSSGAAAVPMSEFWTFSDPARLFARADKSGWISWEGISKMVASACHTYGRRYVGAESFTGAPDESRWLQCPYTMKAQGDYMECVGINRFFLNGYMHQPWKNVVPGVTMGDCGTQFANNTWWEQAAAWVRYLARNQFLLQQGTFIADVAVYMGERTPAATMVPQPEIPRGYDYDLLDKNILLHGSGVHDGKLVLQSGTEYRYLLLPPSEVMTPEAARKIRTLVLSGVTVIGPRPCKSPSLTNYPACDKEVCAIAAELWGENPTAEGQRACGKGRVIWGKPWKEILAADRLAADFQCVSPKNAQLSYIHRRTQTADIYFVASHVYQAREALCRFRVTGKRPEFWHSDTEIIEPCLLYRETGGQTEIPIHFDPAGSVFVVFRDGAPSDHFVSVTADDESAADPSFSLITTPAGTAFEAWEPGRWNLISATGKTVTVAVQIVPAPLAITGPWEVKFQAQRGAPEKITLDKLISWSAHSDPGVKYFSGTGTYLTKFNVPSELLNKDRRLLLDLGRVEVIAEVTLNGQNLGVLWKAPFRLDVADVLKPGENVLQVRLANLWVNRLIGDEQLPNDCWTRSGSGGFNVKSWPDWLVKGAPRTSGRITFSTEQHWTKDDPLVPSGLLGPVTLRVVERRVLN